MFYIFVDTTDPIRRRLFDEADYEEFFRSLGVKFFSQDFFRPFYENSVAPEMVCGYMGASATGIYRRWKSAQTQEASGSDGSGSSGPGETDTTGSGITTIEELTDFTTDLLQNGIGGMDQSLT